MRAIALYLVAGIALYYGTGIISRGAWPFDGLRCACCAVRLYMYCCAAVDVADVMSCLGHVACR